VPFVGVGKLKKYLPRRHDRSLIAMRRGLLLSAHHGARFGEMCSGGSFAPQLAPATPSRSPPWESPPSSPDLLRRPNPLRIVLSRLQLHSQVASELGSARSVRPHALQSRHHGAGHPHALASFGFLRATPRLGVNPTLSLLAFLALATNGIQMLWPLTFPLPDPRTPDICLSSSPRRCCRFYSPPPSGKESGSVLKTYFVATLVLLAVMIALVTNKSPSTQRTSGD